MGSLRVDNCTDTDNGFCFAEGRSLERYSVISTLVVIVYVCVFTVSVTVNVKDFPSFFNVQDIRCGA